MFNDTYISDNPLTVLPPVKPPRRLYTLAEYLRKEERSEELHEYENGIIIKLPMARGPHNEITMNMATALNNAFKANGKKYRVFGGQQLVYMPKLNFSRYPDILVICEKPEYFDDNEVLMMNPILIVEVLSKSTRSYDRKGKFDEYKTLASFKEYVIIDQNKPFIETRFQEKPNHWVFGECTDLEGSVDLKSVGCTITLKDIYNNIVLKK
jgi:Uma2 family endonuclease